MSTDDSGDVVKFRGMEMQNLVEQPKLTLGNKYCELLEFEVKTRHDIPILVYCPPNNNIKKTPIVTFHDIGTNHNSFLGFFSYPEMRIILQNFAVYHICAPGHQDAPDSAGYNVRRSSAPNASDDGPSVYTIFRKTAPLKTYPSMDELTDMVEDVVSYFELKYIVGFGMGAGSNVLARYAMRAKSTLSGLFLINPDSSTCAYYPWLHLKWTDLPQLRQGIYSDYLFDFLDVHWFGSDREDTNIHVDEMYTSHFHCLDAQSVAGYIQSYIDRTDLKLQRELQKHLKDSVVHIRTDTCLVCAEKSRDKVRAATEMNGQMDPETTQYLFISDCGGLLLEEHMDVLTTSFFRFLQTIGLVVHLTPKKLSDLVRELHHEKTIAQHTETLAQISNEILQDYENEYSHC